MDLLTECVVFCHLEINRIRTLWAYRIRKSNFLCSAEFSSHRDKDGKLVKIENGVTVTVYDEVEKEIKKDLPTRSHARRQMLKVLNPVVEVPADAAGKKKNTKEVDLVAKLFDEYAPKYATRKGGYTRIVKIGQRKGDAAMTVVLELV